MLFILKRKGVVQNLGWWDRMIRFLGAFALLAYPLYAAGDSPLLFWHYIMMIVSAYPLLTSILGWDPLYSAIGLRSCDTSDRNRCGSFPYEVDRALGGHHFEKHT